MIRDYHCVMQEGPSDCGACSILTIVQSYGGDMSLEYVRELTKTTRDGTNAYLMVEALKEIGFKAEVLKGNILDMTKDMFPCISHVIINGCKHFIVIHKINKKNNTLLIADPARGRKVITYGEFLEMTTDNYIVMHPEIKIPKLTNENVIFNQLIELFIKHKKVLITILINSIIYTFINIFISYRFQIIIDNVISYQSKSNLNLIIIVITFLMITKDIVDIYRNTMINYLNHHIDNTLITNFFSHILLLPYQYYKNRTTGEVITRVQEIGEIKEVLSNLILVVTDVILILFSFFFLFKLSKHLLLITFIIMVLYFLLIYLFTPVINYYLAKNKDDISLVNSKMYEYINSVETNKGLMIEDKLINRFKLIYDKYIKNSYYIQKILNTINFFKNLIEDMGIIFILFIGSNLVLKDSLSLSEFITFNSLLYYYLDPIKNVLSFILNYKNIKINVKRINDLYSIKKEELKPTEKYITSEINKISFKKLSYSYQNSNNVLKDITLSIEASEKILITGESGSGKSTLAKILLKYLDVDRNMILLNGRDIRDWDNLSIRENICYVSQNELLFSDSLYNNVVLDRLVSYEEFLDVAKIANLESLLKVGNDYDVRILENGFNFSGGERQRIILARSLLKKASVYIFDESLSQMDVELERKILKRVFKTYKDKIFIIISHRFNNEDLFDKKYRIDKGKIYEY